MGLYILLELVWCPIIMVTSVKFALMKHITYTCEV